MALDQDREFIDDIAEADARQAGRRISVVGVLIAFILGFVLVSLLIYGRILTDDARISSVPPSTVAVPEAPAPSTP